MSGSNDFSSLICCAVLFLLFFMIAILVYHIETSLFDSDIFLFRPTRRMEIVMMAFLVLQIIITK